MSLAEQAHAFHDDHRGAVDATAAGAGLGLAGLVYDPAKRMTTGMETFYHGTKKPYAQAIREEGILGSHANRKGSVTEAVNIADSLKNAGKDPSLLNNKVYVTRKQNIAQGVLDAQRLHRRAESDPILRRNQDEILRVNIPYADLHDGTLHRTANPELLGMNKKDWIQNRIAFARTQPEYAMLDAQQRAMAEKVAPYFFSHAYKRLDEPNTYTFEGKVDPRYIEGSRHYEGMNASKWGKYVRRHTGRFAGGLGLGALGLGGLGLAGMAGHDYLTHKGDE